MPSKALPTGTLSYTFEGSDDDAGRFGDYEDQAPHDYERPPFAPPSRDDHLARDSTSATTKVSPPPTTFT